MVRRLGDSATFSADGLVAISPTAGFGADAVLQAERSAGFSCDLFSFRLPTEQFREQLTRPVLLIELRLPGGTIRVSGRSLEFAGLAWGGRLVTAGTILRTLTSGTDELQIELDDTTTRGARFRDLFAADDPEGSGVSVWLGLADDPAQNRMHLFEGRIERIPGFTHVAVTINVIRNEVVEDRLLGRIVSLADFSSAPEESLGRMIPLVYGLVEDHEGVVVDTNAVGQLAVNHFVSDTVLRLRDASSFPASGTVVIAEERIDYGARDRDLLTDLTRGADGTAATDHGIDAQVREVGQFVVKWADHQVGRLDTFRILDPNGNLGEPVPPPDSVDHALATATWGELPRIRSPGTDSVFNRVHFRDVGAENGATNPQFAARENLGYETFGFAVVGNPSSLHLVTNTEELGEPGDIMRVWIAVVFDPGTTSKALFLGGGATVLVPAMAGEVGGAIRIGSILRLVNHDLTPIEIARHDDRLSDRLYDVEADIPTIEPEKKTITIRSTLVTSGIWSNSPKVVDHQIMMMEREGAQPILDEDESTGVISMGVPGELSATNPGLAMRADFAAPDIGNFSVVAARLKLFVDTVANVPIFAPLLGYLEDQSGKVPGTEVVGRSTITVPGFTGEFG